MKVFSIIYTIGSVYLMTFTWHMLPEPMTDGDVNSNTWWTLPTDIFVIVLFGLSFLSMLYSNGAFEEMKNLDAKN